VVTFVTVIAPLLVQPPDATVTPSCTEVPEPAVNEITFVPWPLVIVPPLMVQEYVVPAGPAVTEAVAVAPLSTLAGAVIVAFGSGSTVTGTDAEVAEHPLAPITVTL
jgi:hypothetical protein